MIQRYPSALIQNAVATLLLAVLLCGNSLMRVAVSAQPAVPASDLPADGIYPQGRKLVFAGYSGDPARDLANGFTLAGPVYGDQELYLEHCFARATGLERWFLWCNGAGRSEGDKALWSLVPYGKGWVSDFSWNVCMERW